MIQNFPEGRRLPVTFQIGQGPNPTEWGYARNDYLSKDLKKYKEYK